MYGIDLNPPATGAAQAAAAACLRDHLYLCGDALLERRDMGYNTDKFTILLQARKSLQGGFESIFVESAESFIEKERIHPYIAAGHLRKAERQGKTNYKAFAAGEILRGPDLTGLVVVDDIQFQRL